AVRDHVQGRLNLNFEALGPLILKNIARPIEAFVLRVSPGETEPTRIPGINKPSQRARTPGVTKPSQRIRISGDNKSSYTRGVSPSIRTNALDAVNTPVGVFVLVVLIVE